MMEGGVSYLQDEDDEVDDDNDEKVNKDHP